MAQLEDFAQAARLEKYRSRHEAAKGFEDDLEFCPSLSAEELAEIRRQVPQLVSHGQSKPNSTTPPQHKRPIPIIDPSNKTPLNITPIKPSGSSASAAAQAPVTSTFFSRPDSPFSYGSNYSPSYQTISTSVKVTKSIPIIDPSSGNIVNMPNSGTTNTNNGNNTGFGGFYSDISVR